MSAVQPDGQDANLTIPEVAALVRRSEKTVRRAISRGELVAYMVGGRWLIRRSDVEAWIERGRNVPEQEPELDRPSAPPVRGSREALRRIEADAA